MYYFFFSFFFSFFYKLEGGGEGEDFFPQFRSRVSLRENQAVCLNLETLLFNGALRVGVLVCCIIFVVQMRILNKNGVVTSRRTVNYRHLLGVYGLLRESNKYFLATQGFGFCDLIRTTVPLSRLEWQAPLLITHGKTTKVFIHLCELLPTYLSMLFIVSCPARKYCIHMETSRLQFPVRLHMSETILEWDVTP